MIALLVIVAIPFNEVYTTTLEACNITHYLLQYSSIFFIAIIMIMMNIILYARVAKTHSFFPSPSQTPELVYVSSERTCRGGGILQLHVY